MYELLDASYPRGNISRLLLAQGLIERAENAEKPCNGRGIFCDVHETILTLSWANKLTHAIEGEPTLSIQLL